MKKTALIAAALTMVLALAACGNMDKNNSNGGTALGDTNGTNGINGTNGTNDVNGTYNVNDPATGSSRNGTTANGTTASSRSTVGSDLRRAADDVGSSLRRAADSAGNAATELADDGRDMAVRGASATSFERMLDNARVHDTDGVLADGENSRW